MIQIFRDSLAILQKKERRKFKAGIILTLMVSIVDILSLAILLFIVSYYTQSTKSSGFSFMPAWSLSQNSVFLIAVFLVLFGLKNLVAFLVFRFQYSFICQVSNRLSFSKLSSFLDGDYKNYIDIDSAAHIRRINHNPTEFCYYVLAGIQQIITELMLVSLAIIAIAIYNPKLFVLLFLVLLPPVAVVFYIIKKRLRKVSAHTKSNSERSLQHLQEALEGYVESNIYDKKAFFLKRYTTYQQLFNKHLSEAMIVQGMPHRIMEVFAVLGLFLLIVVSQATAAQGSAFVTLGAFMAGAYKIIPGIVKILNLGGQIKTYEFTIKDLKPEKNISPEKTRDPKKIDSIEFKHVHFAFSEREVLHDFNLQLQQGDFVGLSGRSGEGKTTVLNILLGFLSPSRGDILINGKSTGEVERRGYWPSIAYVKQQNFLLHDTILHNITLDEEKVDESKLNCAISASGLNALLSKYHEGLQKMITEDGKNISGGERQRIAIARALYKNADLIILDEPFNELDEASEYALLTYFQQLAKKGRIVILITHHTQGLEFCNKTVALHEAHA